MYMFFFILAQEVVLSIPSLSGLLWPHKGLFRCNYCTCTGIYVGLTFSFLYLEEAVIAEFIRDVFCAYILLQFPWFLEALYFFHHSLGAIQEHNNR